MEANLSKKEAYYTATQMQLVRTRFFGNKSAMIAGSILLFMIVCSLFSDFLSPYDPTINGRDKDYENGAPQIPMFWDENGFSKQGMVTYFRIRLECNCFCTSNCESAYVR